MKKTVYYFDEKRKVKTSLMTIVDGVRAVQITERHLIFSIYDHDAKAFVSVDDVKDYLNDYELRMFCGAGLDNGILLAKNIDDFNREATRYFQPKFSTLFPSISETGLYQFTEDLHTKLKIVADGSITIKVSIMVTPTDAYNADNDSAFSSLYQTNDATNGGVYSLSDPAETDVIIVGLLVTGVKYFFVTPASDVITLPNTESNPVSIQANFGTYYKDDFETTHPLIKVMMFPA